MGEEQYELTQNEIDYILEDRQWLRQHRIMRARVEMRRTRDSRQKWFWRFIIDVNSI